MMPQYFRVYLHSPRPLLCLAACTFGCKMGGMRCSLKWPRTTRYASKLGMLGDGLQPFDKRGSLVRPVTMPTNFTRRIFTHEPLVSDRQLASGTVRSVAPRKCRACIILKLTEVLTWLSLNVAGTKPASSLKKKHS